MIEHPVSYYAHALRPALPANLFEPAPRRLLWLVLHAAVATAGILVLAAGWIPWSLALLVSLVIGHSFAGTAFVAHEALHGSVVRNRRARLLVGWLGFLPFTFSPRLWSRWHNQVHHSNTGREGVDPDLFANLDDYRKSRVVRAVHRLSPGYGNWAGFVTLLIGLSGQHAKVFVQARRVLAYSRREHLVAIAETAAGLAFWATVAILVGPLPFLFGFVLPLFVGNAILISYILTNHGLSPFTEINDPLLNSLSVTTPRFVAILHLHFGLHVEHHIFPSMSSRHAPRVQSALLERWPERYQSLPFGQALRRLFTTSRIHKDARTLIEPVSGREFVTLAPRGDGG